MVEPQLADTNPWSPHEHGLVDWTSSLRIDDNNSSYDNRGDDKPLVLKELEQGKGQEHGLAPTSKSGTQKLGLMMDPALNLSTSTLIEPLDENFGIRKCKLQLVLQQVTHGKELIDQHLARTGDFLERDVLEHQVQKLQTQVAETKAIVAELETRLNLAEWSNRHIVEELKMLLADAEGTLVGSDECGSESGETTNFPRHAQDEDVNVIYNRICVVLQSLILDAQKALQRTSISVASSCQCPNCDEINHHHLLPRPHPSLYLSESSFDSERFWDHPTPRTQQYTMRPSLYSGNNDYSRILWQQKQQEQHERYRKSCSRLNQELDIGLVDARVVTGSESDSSFYGSISLASPSSSSPPSSASSTQPSSPISISYRPGVLRAPLKSSIKGRFSSDSEASSEPRRKKNQVQFVDSDETPKRRPSRSPRRVQRRYKSQAVGSNSSTNIVMQLYGLWKQTWLRTRIMHVLTGSVEIMVVVFVLIRSVKASLSWVGLQSWAEMDWFSWLYGHRDSGASAKELYEKIKRDGLQWRHVQLRQIKEPEAPEAATSLLSPARVVYGPAKKALKDVAAGAALAYVSDNVWRLIKKF